MDQLPAGPFGSRPRFVLAAASEDDRSSLRGLGTYGFIQGATAFVIGAAKMEGKWLEDFGCQMETIILYLTSLGLGTCWLGGSFTRSSFGRKIGLKDDEHIPSVTAFGEFADPARARRGLDPPRRAGGGPPAVGAVVLRAGFRHPADSDPGADQLALEMVRLAPSASNKQPWRVVRDGDRFHFFLQRTPGYRESLLKKALGIFDLQRVDMGIAMSHFELTIKSWEFRGIGLCNEPTIKKPG